MGPISKIYRQACRETGLPPQVKELFLQLLREIIVNAVRSRKAWTVKAYFIVLWWMSAGRFPELCVSPYSKTIGDWVGKQLPFALSDEEWLALWS